MYADVCDGSLLHGKGCCVPGALGAQHTRVQHEAHHRLVVLRAETAAGGRSDILALPADP